MGSSAPQQEGRQQQKQRQRQVLALNALCVGVGSLVLAASGGQAQVETGVVGFGVLPTLAGAAAGACARAGPRHAIVHALRSVQLAAPATLTSCLSFSPPVCSRLRPGALLTYGMGPRYVVQRELDIPLGALHVDEAQAVEMAFVLDRTAGWQRVLVGGVYTAALVAVLSM